MNDKGALKIADEKVEDCKQEIEISTTDTYQMGKRGFARITVSNAMTVDALTSV